MERFRAEHGHTWPTSFAGGIPAEDPVGRLYREARAGVFYVIGPDGVLVSKLFGVEELEAALVAFDSGIATGAAYPPSQGKRWPVGSGIRGEGRPPTGT